MNSPKDGKSGMVSLQGVDGSTVNRWKSGRSAWMNGAATVIDTAQGEPSPRIVTANFGDEQAKRIDHYRSNGGYQTLDKALKLSTEDIQAEVATSNLRGRGGAGFPTARKWSFLPKDAQEVYLVVNADESEPGTFKDRWLMYWDPHLLIEGACISAYAIKAHKVYIYIRGELAEGARVLEAAVAEAYASGILGPESKARGWELDMVVHRGAGAYICGEETSLLNSLEGRRGYPRLKPPFPAIKGLFGKPTIVNNVETMMHVPEIVKHGGQSFADMGVPGDGGTRVIALSGHVARPGVYEIPVGMSLRDIIYGCGQGMQNAERPLKGVIPGGSSMPILTADEIDVPYSNDGVLKSELIKEVEVRPGELFRWAGGTLRSMSGSGAITVVDSGTCMVEFCARVMRFYAHESCGQCTPCREGSGWLATLCSRLARGEGKVGDVERLRAVASQIGGNTICALGDAVTWPMLAFLTKYGDEFDAKERAASAQKGGAHV